MRLLYTSLLLISLPIIILRLVWRGMRTPAYWRRWSERFGNSPDLPSVLPVIWIHAVSVGEVEACQPLVNILKADYPNHQILITTMTPTGSDRVKRLFNDCIAHCYLPYDLPFAIRRFIANIKPTFGIIMETEIWPNLLAICAQHNIPLALANARMSARSAKGYARIAGLTKEMLQHFRFIAAQSEQDYQRFQQLGADSRKLHAIGNLKYDIDIPDSLKQQANAMRCEWKSDRPVLIAASTHEGEENILLAAYRQIRITLPELLLIIVPRHPERFDRVVSLAHKSDYHIARRSDHHPYPINMDILVVDTMGELPLFYATSDVAFVGGSLVAHGGHNLLEPAALGRAVITGRHCFNFQDITTQFLNADALLQVSDTSSLATTVIHLFKNPQKRAQMGEAGLKLITANQGAKHRLAHLITDHIIPHVHRP